MTALAYRVPLAMRKPGPVVTAAGLLSALVIGAVLAAQVRIGVAVLLAVCFGVLALVNLPLAVALWVPLIFLEGIYAFNLAGKGAGAVIAVAWVGGLRSRREVVSAALTTHRRLLIVLAGLMLWLTLSLAWADDPSLAGTDLWHWYALVAILVVVMTTVTTERELTRVLGAFVAGAVLSIVIGVADGSFTGAADGGARLEGGAGDPNYLAASIVACTVVAISLLGIRGRPLVRGALMVSVAVLIVGLVSSGSRGGMLAAAVAVMAAMVLFKQRRVHVVAAAAVALGIAALAFVNSPDTWERVTDFNDDNGRSSLWTVGSRMWQDHPVAGVGLNNFVVHSADYVREPGALEHVQLIVERPHVPHNTYLQLLAENGIVGLAFFVGAIVACLRLALLAARRFEALGERRLSSLARAVVVATVSMLAAAIFLSAATDKRLWLLLALGPALTVVASRLAAERPHRPAGQRPHLVAVPSLDHPSQARSA